MMELIKIDITNGKQTVNARDLHSFLEIKTKFIDWVKRRIEEYNFEKSNDFIILLKNGKNTGRPSEEYHISIDMAKELSMVERNEKGRQARQYFIECENELKNKTANLTPAELILYQAQQLVDQEKRLASIEDKVKLIEASQETSSYQYFSVAGYCSLKGIRVTLTQASSYGKKCAALSRESDYDIGTLTDPRFGKVNAYHTDILEEIIK